MPVIGLWSASGEPLLGAKPTFASFVGRNGTARPAPDIKEVGGGLYRFAPSRADEAAGVAFLVDCGPGAEPRYYSGAAGAIVAVALYGASGDPWAGAAPSFAFYEGDQPPITRLGAGLFGFSPSEKDRKAGVGYMLAAPAGASPTYHAGNVPPLAPPTAVGPTMRLLGPNGSGTQTIKQGSLLPVLRMQFVDAGGKPIDLTGWDVRAIVSYRQGAPPVVDAPADVVDPGNGIAEYHWRTGDTDRPGILYVEGEVTDEYGRPMTLPSSGRGIVSVDPRLRP